MVFGEGRPAEILLVLVADGADEVVLPDFFCYHLILQGRGGWRLIALGELLLDSEEVGSHEFEIVVDGFYPVLLFEADRLHY